MRTLSILCLAACATTPSPDETDTTVGLPPWPTGPVERVTLTPIRGFPVSSPRGLRVGDLDGDRLLDLAWVDEDGIGGLRGSADGTFVARRWLAQADLDALLGGSTQLFGVELTDLDGDGASDLLVSLTHHGTPQVGSVQDGEWHLIADEDVGVGAVPVADLDGDELPEVVVPGQRVRVLPSGGGEWELGPNLHALQYPALTVRNGELVLCVNYGFGISEVRSWQVVDGDVVPRADLRDHFATHAVFGDAGETYLLSGDVAHRFDGDTIEEVVRLSADEGFGRPLGGDLDGDGAFDLLADGFGDSVLFSGPELVRTPYEGPADDAYEVVLADFDRDGLADMARLVWSTERNRTEVVFYRNTSRE